MIYAIHPKVLIALLSLLFVVNSLSAMADDLPNPYKLDLRKATTEELRQVVAYASRDRVTIVAFAGTDAPWRIIQDAANQLVAQGIPVNIAWANDEDDNIQTANVILFAKGQGRRGTEYSTKIGYINYKVHVEDGAVKRLVSKAKKVHDEFFARSVVR